ncbi:MAG TPA: 2-phosphosulfolactate phosphatase [Ktedonobacterales bacterium]|nr:2-phosphosulfolactate phosphatase [Ktedonobacterales bacterium]
MISGHEAAPVGIDVALTPALLGEEAAPTQTTYIVVDVIRATTTLCVFFERGAREVQLAPDVAAARALRDTLGGGALLAGEIEGAMPPGFDLGNSPVEAARADLAGRTVLFATSNGTRALRACAGGRAVFAGALRNASAVAAAALTAASPCPCAFVGASGERPTGLGGEAPSITPPLLGRTAPPAIVVVCSGRGALPAFDDTLCAGYIVRQFIAAARAEGRGVDAHEGAHIALGVLAGAEAGGGIHAALARSDAFAAIERIGLAGDLDWCAATNVTSVVPQVMGAQSGAGGLAVRAIEQR